MFFALDNMRPVTVRALSNKLSWQRISGAVTDTDDETRHKRLWASVIIQALIDATVENPNPQHQADRKRARDWILAEVGTTAQDFEAVCFAAEIAPDRVRTFIKTYEGPALNLHILSRMRNKILAGTDEDTN